jgi:hypothetical protein
MLSPQKARKIFTTSSKTKERLLYNETSRSFFMAIIWNTQPDPQSASIGVAPDTLSEEEKEDRATEAMDKAMKELDEELEDAREFAFKALEVKAEP